MPDINLLPRRKASDWLRPLRLVLIGFIGAALVIGQIVLTAMMNNHERRLDSEIADMQSRIDSVSRSLLPDEKTALVQQLRHELDRRETMRQPWIDGLAGLYRYMTSDMRWIRLSVDESDVLRAEMHFASMDAYLTFMDRIKQDPRYASVTASELTLVTGHHEGESERVDAPSPIVPSPPEARDDAELLDQYLPDGTSYRDIGSELLELLGVSDSSRGNEDYSSLLSEGTPFTLEELRKLERGQGNAPAGSVPAVTQDVPGGSPASGDTGDYYRVLVEIVPAAGQGRGK